MREINGSKYNKALLNKLHHSCLKLDGENLKLFLLLENNVKFYYAVFKLHMRPEVILVWFLYIFNRL